jgi:predicted phosphoribosyltransferase
MKKYAEGGKLPQDLVDEIARKENEEDRDLVMAPVRAGVKAGKAVAEKLKKDLTGGAATGARLNMPSNTRLGKLSAADTRLLNKEDARKKNPYETEKESGYKKGGSVKSSASKRADGCAIRGKTRA